MKMGDLAKKPQAAEEVSQSTESEVKQPMRSRLDHRKTYSWEVQYQEPDDEHRG